MNYSSRKSVRSGRTAGTDSPRSQGKASTDVSLVPGSRAFGFFKKLWVDLCGPNYQHYKAQMHIFPFVWFKQPDVENDYAASVLPTYIVRVPLGAGILLAMQILYWVLLSSLMKSETLAIHGLLNDWSFCSTG
eukprot:Gregarina_sp_Poly_1__8926@NODE_53_length_17536_cov_99_000057_g45_i0_p11_GENE_NODE_53_length_17536_cov_99_000057_g45_i0NODE_53_length_17536_cov_99_000057_g45_i0_p11_ORF_typecomplete_len133_score9_84_NODE_53_length_17536_cov_99_000057_g45_i01123611634